MHKVKPLVSVIIPFQRVDEFFETAVKSIVEQSYSNLEILLLNNSLLKVKREKVLTDSRIRIVECRSLGTLSQILNKGIKEAKGQYIARMDSDDVSLPLRIEKQVEFLEQRNHIGILGTSIEVIDTENHHIEYRFQPSNHEDIVKRLYYNNPFFHPTIMFRTAVFQESNLRYKNSYVRAQDYELWTRMLNYVESANLNETLVQYRLHDQQAGKQLKYESLFYFRRAQLKFTLKSMFSRKSEWNPKFILRISFRLIQHGLGLFLNKMYMRRLFFKSKTN